MFSRVGFFSSNERRQKYEAILVVKVFEHFVENVQQFSSHFIFHITEYHIFGDFLQVFSTLLKACIDFIYVIYKYADVSHDEKKMLKCKNY